MQTRMEALEENQQRDPVGGDVSDNEEEPKEESVVEADGEKVWLLKSVIGASMRPKPEVPTYQKGWKRMNSLTGLTRWTSSLTMMK